MLPSLLHPCSPPPPSSASRSPRPRPLILLALILLYLRPIHPPSMRPPHPLSSHYRSPYLISILNLVQIWHVVVQTLATGWSPNCIAHGDVVAPPIPPPPPSALWVLSSYAMRGGDEQRWW
ncbi:hypothetical protein B0H17DRAFT_1076007 [Mycena rosella]|uniref:Uncharacterized protein n=1 Tax=Mycena rosella TaxID=1033263 RepID=A0AAD7D778_MYCRO|nr:hypothetical protein B0H17DRAFT_1076007 [Mycena rosella]